MEKLSSTDYIKKSRNGSLDSRKILVNVLPKYPESLELTFLGNRFYLPFLTAITEKLKSSSYSIMYEN